MTASASISPVTHTPWTPAQHDALIELYKQGHTRPAIAQKMGRTQPSINNKITAFHRDGTLDKRPAAKLDDDLILILETLYMGGSSYARIAGIIQQPEHFVHNYVQKKRKHGSKEEREIFKNRRKYMSWGPSDIAPLRTMRMNGYSYKDCAKSLGRTEYSVIKFCARNELTAGALA